MIIGAGFSGLSLLYLLQSKGIDALLLEGSEEVGGTWNQNIYPGVRTDSEAKYYCSTLSQEVINGWDWSERYPTGQEVKDYLKYFASTLNLYPKIKFGCWVKQIVWDEKDLNWQITLASGELFHAARVVLATGLLQKPSLPVIHGIESFGGELLHTSSWPDTGLDVQGKRVGVIGVGSSGVQIIPALAEQASELLVFQRTPNYVVPAVSENLDKLEIENVRHDQHAIFNRCRSHPFGVDIPAPVGAFNDMNDEERQRVLNENWQKGGFHFLCQTFTDMSINDEAAWYASEFIGKKIAELVKDPATAEALTPRDYPVGAKRLSTGIKFYETFNEPNVQLIDVKSTPITQIDNNGVWVGERHFPLDVLVCATGFDALTGSIDAIQIRGRQGLLLSKYWESDGLNSFLGLSVHGFPNLFMMLGPHTPAGNLAVIIQEQAEWIAKLLVWARDNDISILESSEVQDKWWAEYSLSAVRGTVMDRYSNEARAWFFGHNVHGKKIRVNTFFGGLPKYLEYLSSVEERNYSSFLENDVV